MSKSILVALCIVMAVLATMTVAAPTATIKFVDNKITPTAVSLVDISLSGLSETDLSFVFTPGVAPGETPVNPTFWRFLSLGLPPTPAGYDARSCFDSTTGQIVGKVSLSSTSFTLNLQDPSSSAPTSLYYQIASKAITAVNMRCYLVIDSGVKPDYFNINVQQPAGVGWSTPATLAAPANGVVVPLVDFKSASVSRPVDEFWSTAELNIQFSTDTAGTYTLGFSNGISSAPQNNNNAQFADFFCQSGSVKDAARIVYSEAVYLVVDEKAIKDTIKCTVLLSNDNNEVFVQSDRMIVQIAFSNVVVSRTLDFTPVTPGILGYFYTDSDTMSELKIYSTNLQLSAAALKTNSTIEFKFSKQIDVSFLQLVESSSSDTSYQKNANCYGILGTSFVDTKANTVTLKDIVLDSNNYDGALDCQFDFAPGSFAFDQQANMASVIVKINGVTLTALQAPGTAAPLYLTTVGQVSSLEHKETETETTVTVLDTFKLTDQYTNTFQVMKDPMVVISVQGQLTVNAESYKNHVSCEITTPSTSVFKKFELKFDDERLVWTAKLKDLIDAEKYDVLLKCTRDVKKITKYSLDITPVSSLTVTFINLLDSKRHFGSNSASGTMITRQQAPELATPAYPATKAVAVFRYVDTFILPDVWDNKTLKDLSASYQKSLTDAITVDQKKSWDNFNLFYSTVEPIVASRAYANVVALVDQFAWVIQLVKDKAVSWFTPFTAPFSNIHPPTEQFGDIYSQFTSTADVSIHFTADMTDPDAPVPNPIAIEWKSSQYAKKYRTETVPQSAAPSTSGNRIGNVIPTEGCGYEKGYVFHTTENAGFNFAQSGTRFPDAQAKWSNWSNNFKGPVAFYGCQETETCSMNADCGAGLYCILGKCSSMKQVLPSYVDVSAFKSEIAPAVYDKQDFNSATLASTIFAVIAIALAIVV